MSPRETGLVAVLLCFRQNEPEARLKRAIASTALRAPAGTTFFLHADGGEPASRANLESAAGSCAVEWFVSASPVGLAAGLNRLIDRVLDRPEFGFLARMDADDASVEGRLERQREVFENDPTLDILGTACRESGEDGNFLQTKTIPGTHEEILSRLPWRNPLNHPTVMMRRRVFANGLRYRTNVRLMEDYFLWVDAAAAGFRFANLAEPWLDYTRDPGFFGRRSGWGQACAEWNVRRYAADRLGVSSLSAWAAAGAAFLLRLLPGAIQAGLYKKLR